MYGDVEKEIQRDKEQNYRNKKALQKNNEELDSICNKICLCIGWSSILCLFGGLLFVIIKKKFD